DPGHELAVASNAVGGIRGDEVAAAPAADNVAAAAVDLDAVVPAAGVDPVGPRAAPEEVAVRRSVHDRRACGPCEHGKGRRGDQGDTAAHVPLQTGRSRHGLLALD